VSEGLKDSGTRTEFASGAVRDGAAKKGRLDLIPYWPMLAYGAILEAGAKKYAPNNWRKGMPISSYIKSAENHLQKYKSGFRDEPHLWQALWNIAGAVHTQIQIYLGIYPAAYNDLWSDITLSDSPELLGEFEKEYMAPFAKEFGQKKDDQGTV
jgi:hypothetical protein